MARTLEAIKTDIQQKTPVLRRMVDGEYIDYSSTEYNTAIDAAAQTTLEAELVVDQEAQDRVTRLAIIGRLRNNTATNDDRNRAILFILRTLRADI